MRSLKGGAPPGLCCVLRIWEEDPVRIWQFIKSRDLTRESLKKKEIIVFKYFGNFQSLNHIVKCLLIVAPLACEEVNSRFKTGTPDSQRQQPGEPHRFTMMSTHY